jgi:UDP-4-amino-4,6-dideoxy-N-acetyl-beta-L-altrosamine transaminase
MSAARKLKEDEQTFLPYGRHVIDDSDIAAVTAALKSDYLTTGPLVGKFESALAHAVNAKEAVVCSNGTAALHLAAHAFGLRAGKIAIVPSITFVATANAVRMTGADVVFADVNPETGLMEAHHLAGALSRCPGGRADAVIPVHLNGQCADLGKLSKLARENKLTIIEDACHAIGTTYTPRRGQGRSIGACAHSDAACFSFHPVKTIAMGEGGAVTTNDADRAAKMRQHRSHGLIRDEAGFINPDSRDAGGDANPWSYEMHEWGYNYRATDILCALGLSQLKKLDRFVSRRTTLVAEYDRLLGRGHNCVRPIGRTEGCAPAWHLYVIQIDFETLGIDRATVMRRLSAHGIGTQVHYYPVHRQPYYAKLYGTANLPGADAYYTQALSLPLFPAMDRSDVARVVDALMDALL